ncbi:hypothetical protein TIFTF001_046700 [Ficus carica]|uniref:Retrotransposon gag domain-containing protein n=1 Tax=Ficus carica TaxID=3494 RepID=A0AA87ZWS4_FICCA|nr:hypothetical protein TIFTF001_046700 [Ficus carica]
MDLTDNEKVKCAFYCLMDDARIWWEGIELSSDISQMTWEDFVQEFNEQYFNMSVTREHYDEFNNFRQGNLSVTEAVKRFNQLARLCPYMVPNEQERLRRMIGMLKPEIAVIVDSGTTPPTTTAECVKCALRAEYHLNKQKESQPRQNEVPKNNNNNQNRGNFGNQGKSQGVPYGHKSMLWLWTRGSSFQGLSEQDLPALPAKTTEKPTSSAPQYAGRS